MAPPFAVRAGCQIRHSEGQRRTESDGKVEDKATPEHASDGLDCGGGHLGGICWSCMGGCGLRTGMALVDVKLAVG